MSNNLPKSEFLIICAEEIKAYQSTSLVTIPMMRYLSLVFGGNCQGKDIFAASLVLSGDEATACQEIMKNVQSRLE